LGRIGDCEPHSMEKIIEGGRSVARCEVQKSSKGNKEKRANSDGFEKGKKWALREKSGRKKTNLIGGGRNRQT